jgi:hypothetical protein
MAITIQERPYQFTRLGQKLIVRATSTNVGNTGFKYVVKIDIQGNIIATYYVSPNPEGELVFDLMDALKDFVSVDVYDNVLKSSTLNFQISPFTENYPLFVNGFTLYEGWVIDGVFVEDIISDPPNGTIWYFPCSYSVMDGYRPDPNDSYGFEAIPPFNVVSRSLFMGDRNQYTHRPQVNLSGVANLGSEYYVAIPVRKSEKDWGVINTFTGLFETSESFANLLYCKWTLKKADGTTVEYSDQLSDEVAFYHIPAYPANLNVGDLSPVIPSDFPDWQWYSVQLFEDSELTIVRSALYVFYPVEDDCIYENIRLCWWSPIKGGFDFFNFSKVSQKSVDVERKRIKKIIGNYGDASSGFTFATSDRGLSETSVSPITYLDITSDWIQEGEYRLLSNLVRSRYVWIINDDGNATPVVVDTNSFTERRERNGKLSRVTFRLRYSNENFYY